jgi:MFS family permease
MILFGHLADRWGRKKLYGIELLTVIVASICLAQASEGKEIAGQTSMNIYGWLIAFRFLLGIGLGAEYPLSAIITAEWASTQSRATMLAAVFLMQPLGQLAAYAINLGVLMGYSRSHGLLTTETDRDKTIPVLDAVWRIVIGVGAIPALFAIILRFTIPETPRYVLEIEDNPRLAVEYAAKVYEKGANIGTSTEEIGMNGIAGTRMRTQAVDPFSQWIPQAPPPPPRRAPPAGNMPQESYVEDDSTEPPLTAENSEAPRSPLRHVFAEDEEVEAGPSGQQAGTENRPVESLPHDVDSEIPTPQGEDHNFAESSADPNESERASRHEEDRISVVLGTPSASVQDSNSMRSRNARPGHVISGDPSPFHEGDHSNQYGQRADGPPRAGASRTSRAPSRYPQFELKEIRKHLSEQGRWRLLWGALLCWFCVDIAVYGLGLNNPRTIWLIWESAPANGTTPPKDWQPDVQSEDLPILQILKQDSIRDMITISIGSGLGSLIILLSINYLPRAAWMAWMFFALAILFAVAGATFFKVFDTDAHALTITLYVLVQLVFNLGPNTLTFIIPAEIFPTKYRGTFYGLAAAAGKFGSIIVQLVKKETHNGMSRAARQYLGGMLLAFCPFMLLGALIAWMWIPEVQEPRPSAEEVAKHGLTYRQCLRLPNRSLEEIAKEPTKDQIVGFSGTFQDLASRLRRRRVRTETASDRGTYSHVSNHGDAT